MMMLVGSASNTPEESSAETCIHKKFRKFPQGFGLPGVTQWRQKCSDTTKSMVSLDEWELCGPCVVRIRKQQRGSRGDEGAN